MKFPSVERVAYSTCSIHEEENELVVKKVLDKNPSFELVNISQEWNSLKGSEKFVTNGDYTVKTDPKTDGIDGFFVAVF
jgi:25S rRNA (cytosine2278-C5)-methyltransferase